MTDRAVLFSIKPKYCELIASGKKTVEVRKTRPKIPTPFKGYIYCTKKYYRSGDGYFQGKYCGKVIGEFVCDEIISFGFTPYNHGEYMVSGDINNEHDILKESCLSFNEMYEYIGETFGYGYHISKLAIYDKPKELSEFRTICNYRNDDGSCQYDKVECDCCKFDFNPDYSVNLAECLNYMQRPPQSWFYVQEVRK